MTIIDRLLADKAARALPGRYPTQRIEPMTITPFPERVSIAPTGREYRRLTPAELAEIMPTAAQPLSSAITVASVVLIFVAGWVVGLLTVLFTL